jgi:hypothetical protein
VRSYAYKTSKIVEMEEENALRQVGVMNFAWQSMGIEKKIFCVFL